MPDLRYHVLRDRVAAVIDESMLVGGGDDVDEVLETFCQLADDLLEALRGALIPGLSEAWAAAKGKGVPVSQLYRTTKYEKGLPVGEEWTAFSGVVKSATAETPEWAILKLAGITLPGATSHGH